MPVKKNTEGDVFNFSIVQNETGKLYLTKRAEN